MADKKSNQNEQILLNHIIQENLLRLREANELTQKQVADAIGVKPNTYTVWESSSKSGIKLPNLLKLAKVYGVDISFFTEDHHSSSENNHIASSDKYDDQVYGDEYLVELNNYEKLMIMKTRRLNKKDKDKVTQYINSLITDIDK